MPSRMRAIGICVPSLGKVSTRWAGGLRDLAWPINTAEALWIALDQPVAEARNALVVNALKVDDEQAEISHLLWLDDDVVFGRNLLTRLLSHNRDVASGVYFTKSDPGWPLLLPGLGQGTLPFVPDTTVECWGHGMGLCLVKLDVYRRMLAELDIRVDAAGNWQWYRTPGSDEMAVDGHQYQGGSEDTWFCHNAAKIGIKPLVDMSRDCFGWHYDLNSGHGYPVKQFNQMKAGQPIVWDTPNGQVVWR